MLVEDKVEQKKTSENHEMGSTCQPGKASKARELGIRLGVGSHPVLVQLWDSYLTSSRNKNIDLLWGTAYTQSE